MSEIETEAKREAIGESPAAVWAPDAVARAVPRRRLRIIPLLITLATIALASGLGSAMWDAYMGAPWTRDGTVRAYTVTMASENFKIAVSLAEAAVRQAQANAQNVERQAQRRQNLSDLAETVEDRHTFASNALVAQAQYQQAVANLDQARVNLERTQIRSPVNGWVTNLLAQLGDYATVGQNEISLVDADSFWVDGYFEETNLASIREGAPASIKLIGDDQIVRVMSLALPAASTSRTRNPTGKASPRSTRSSLGYALLSASLCASTSMRSQTACDLSPGRPPPCRSILDDGCPHGASGNAAGFWTSGQAAKLDIHNRRVPAGQLDMAYVHTQPNVQDPCYLAERAVIGSIC